VQTIAFSSSGPTSFALPGHVDLIRRDRLEQLGSQPLPYHYGRIGVVDEHHQR
jgi:hypothetical protein